MVTIGGIPVYDALITDEETGMMKISLVDDPAVMSDFLAFDNIRKMQMYSVTDDEKRLVRGVVMRADFPIYRRDERMGEYYIIYKPETIRTMAEKYLAESRQNDVNVMHSVDVDGVQMVQWFIQDSTRGIVPEGFDVPDGSLFAEFHVINDEVWESVKDGTYKGFSLEGVFDLVPEQDVNEVRDIVDSLDGQFNSQNDKEMSKLQRIRAGLARLLAIMGNVTTDKGVLAWDGDEDLKAGDKVYIEDQDGNRTDAADGDYRTEDGKTIVVVEGVVAEIRDPEAEVAPEPAPEAEAEAVKLGRVATDRGDLFWEGEDELREGALVYVESEGETVPAPDGDYKTEDGKTIRVEGGAVAAIIDPEAEVAPEADPRDEELAALRAENAELKARLEELRKQPAAKPAHEEVKANAEVVRTGNKGLDRLAAMMGK